MLRKASWLGALCMLLSYTSGCNSDSSVKLLNEANAKKLVQERASKETLKAALSDYSRLLRHTLTDFNTVVADETESTFRQMMAAGLVSHTVDTVQYPAISGVFSGRKDCGQGLVS
jgi:hypothetical protein